MPKIADAEGGSALSVVTESLAMGSTPNRADLALAVRWLLQVLERSAPGNTVEVRVPPFGAVQFVEGPRHTRGTPPNVVEMDALTFVAVCTGSLTWESGFSSGMIHASGIRSDLSEVFPLRTEAE